MSITATIAAVIFAVAVTAFALIVWLTLNGAIA